MRSKRAKAIRKFVNSVDLNEDHIDNIEDKEEELRFKRMYARRLRRWWNRHIDRDIISMLTEDYYNVTNKGELL